jgi:hypothetical protein
MPIVDALRQTYDDKDYRFEADMHFHPLVETNANANATQNKRY